MDTYTTENDFGCTKRDGVSDMTETSGTLIQQMDKAGVKYIRTELNMGSANADPCYLVHYTSTKTNEPMTILVFPQAGIDSWAEDYYYFSGMTLKDALSLNWHEVYAHVQRVSWETIKSKVQVAQYCPTCHKAPVETYEDLRGKKRCKTCNTHTLDNKAEYWKK